MKKSHMQKIKQCLQNGEILTNDKIRLITGTLDGRKYLSDLRSKHGWAIADRVIDGSKRKEYWLNKAA